MHETAETNCEGKSGWARILCFARNPSQAVSEPEPEPEPEDSGPDLGGAISDFMRNLGAALNLGGGAPGEGNGGPYVYSEAPGTTGEGREARPGELGNVASSEGAPIPSLTGEGGILRNPAILFGVGIVLALVARRIG